MKAQDGQTDVSAPLPARVDYSVRLPEGLPAAERLAEGLAAYFLAPRPAEPEHQPSQAGAAGSGAAHRAAGSTALHGMPGDMHAGEPSTPPRLNAMMSRQCRVSRQGQDGMLVGEAAAGELGTQPWQPGLELTDGVGSQQRTEQLVAQGPHDMMDRDVTMSEHAAQSWQPGLEDTHCMGTEQCDEQGRPGIVVGDSTSGACTSERWLAHAAIVLNAPAPLADAHRVSGTIAVLESVMLPDLACHVSAVLISLCSWPVQRTNRRIRRRAQACMRLKTGRRCSDRPRRWPPRCATPRCGAPLASGSRCGPPGAQAVVQAARATGGLSFVRLGRAGVRRAAGRHAAAALRTGRRPRLRGGERARGAAAAARRRGRAAAARRRAPAGPVAELRGAARASLLFK